MPLKAKHLNLCAIMWINFYRKKTQSPTGQVINELHKHPQNIKSSQMFSTPEACALFMLIRNIFGGHLSSIHFKNALYYIITTQNTKHL